MREGNNDDGSLPIIYLAGEPTGILASELFDTALALKDHGYQVEITSAYGLSTADIDHLREHEGLDPVTLWSTDLDNILAADLLVLLDEADRHLPEVAIAQSHYIPVKTVDGLLPSTA